MPQRWFEIGLGDDNRVEQPLKAKDDDFFGVDPDVLWVGRRVDNWNPKSYLRSQCLDDDGDPDDFLWEALHLPVLSPRLQQALGDAGVNADDIQYLPVRVLESTGEEIKGFAVANVVSRVMALDRERCGLLMLDHSRIDAETGQPHIRGIGTTAVKADALKGHDVVRLIEFFPPILVSERFVSVVRKGKFTGATFAPLKTT